MVGIVVVWMHLNLFDKLRYKYPSLDRNNVNSIANKLNNAYESRKILFTNNFSVALIVICSIGSVESCADMWWVSITWWLYFSICSLKYVKESKRSKIRPKNPTSPCCCCESSNMHSTTQAYIQQHQLQSLPATLHVPPALFQQQPWQPPPRQPSFQQRQQ